MNKMIVVVVLMGIFCANTYGEDKRKISVIGQSRSEVMPDTASVSVMLRQVSPTTQESRKRVLQSLKDVVRALKKEGIARDAVSQSHISQGKHSEWRDGRNVALGYYSQLVLVVKVEALDRLTGVYNQLSQFKPLQIQHTAFSHSKRKLLDAQQRDAAILDAKAKASAMLKVLEQRLGKVLLISEHGPINHGPMRSQGNFAVARMESDEGAKVDFGKIQLSAEITVEFEIE